MEGLSFRERETEYAVARRRMIERLATRGITDLRVLESMARLPRHHFLDEGLRSRAYESNALPIGWGQTLTHPETTAKVTEALELLGPEKVLEVGTGSGYQTALLASLAGAVWTIERIGALGRRARELLYSLGYSNIHFRCGDGANGWPEAAPFDRVLCTAACESPPESLLNQVGPSGLLLYPRGTGEDQELVRVQRRDNRWQYSSLGTCRFVPLIRDAETLRRVDGSQALRAGPSRPPEAGKGDT